MDKNCLMVSFGGSANISEVDRHGGCLVLTTTELFITGDFT